MSDATALTAALGRQARFTCRPCPLPTNENDDPIVVYPTHRLGPPTAVDDESVPLELRRLAALFDGSQLFYASYPSGNQEFPVWESSALDVLSVAEIMKRSGEFGAKYQHDRWLRGLLVVARSNSGDLYVADPRGAQEDWPVHHLDHECFFGGSYPAAALEPLAPSLLAFLVRAATNPLPFLSSWRHLDERHKQYYVESVEFTDA